jgi:prepilin-type processing-associated H-X9-DG protein
MEFYNTSADDVTINYGFVDGSVTADEFKNKACKNE